MLTAPSRGLLRESPRGAAAERRRTAGYALDPALIDSSPASPGLFELRWARDRGVRPRRSGPPGPGWARRAGTDRPRSRCGGECCRDRVNLGGSRLCATVQLTALRRANPPGFLRLYPVDVRSAAAVRRGPIVLDSTAPLICQARQWPWWPCTVIPNDERGARAGDREALLSPFPPSTAAEWCSPSGNLTGPRADRAAGGPRLRWAGAAGTPSCRFGQAAGLAPWASCPGAEARDAGGVAAPACRALFEGCAPGAPRGAVMPTPRCGSASDERDLRWPARRRRRLARWSDAVSVGRCPGALWQQEPSPRCRARAPSFFFLVERDRRGDRWAAAVGGGRSDGSRLGAAAMLRGVRDHPGACRADRPAASQRGHPDLRNRCPGGVAAAMRRPGTFVEWSERPFRADPDRRSPL